jgi:hypothetical protein
VRFRRKGSAEDQGASPETAQDESTPTAAENDQRAEGPWDASEVDLDPTAPEAANRIDLGGLVVTGHPALEVQLQVDETTGSVAAVLLAGEEGAVELRPFAAPRGGDIWADFRRQIAAEVTQHGGTVDEDEGPWGPELRVMLPVQLPDGQTGTQPSRVLGIQGPRWLLRATLFGRPALEPSEDGDVETALRSVVVVRGSTAMSPGEPIPMQVPADAQRIEMEPEIEPGTDPDA